MLAHLAERKGVITQVSHQRRTSPLLVTLRHKVLEHGRCDVIQAWSSLEVRQE